MEFDGCLWVNRLSKEIVTARPGPVAARSFADRLVHDWAHPLHYGDFGGLTTKLLYLAACVAVDGLYITGVWMWFLRKNKQSRSARRAPRH